MVLANTKNIVSIHIMIPSTKKVGLMVSANTTVLSI